MYIYGSAMKKAYQSVIRDEKCKTAKTFMHTYEENALRYTLRCNFWGSTVYETSYEAMS